jgi:hypothetical protein
MTSSSRFHFRTLNGVHTSRGSEPQTYVKTTYILLTPASRVLLEKLTGSQLVKKFPILYRTQILITAFTRSRHLSLSWASSIQSMPPHPTSWRSILILSSHLRLDLPNGLFPSSFPIKTLYTPLLSLDTHLQLSNNKDNVPVNGTWLLKHESRTAYCSWRKESRCFTYRDLSCSVKELFIAVTSLRHFLQF